MLDGGFATLADLVRAHAEERPDDIALADPDRRMSWAELDGLVDRIAARLQRDGLAKGDRTAIAGLNSVEHVAVILGTVRAGGVAGLVTSSATGDQMTAMIADTGARHLFLDRTAGAALERHAISASHLVAMDGSEVGDPLGAWIASEAETPAPVEIRPEDDFNIIYSSGMTGTPKGIIHTHALRWNHITRGAPNYGPAAATIFATPLYSNTTMASFMPTVGSGARTVLMRKFDARGFLELAERERATNTMLVPVQYRRIMAVEDFDRFDLSSFFMKFCTSAPFSAALKADILARWPGGLVEIYGMTEGGAAFVLEAHNHPDKLHTVGKPAPRHIVKVIDEDGVELPEGSVGEIVGRSPAMMTGYNNRPDATEAMRWHDADGALYYRHGDIGRIDEDGFLILMDRAKDMIISGGFNIFPSDLEAILHADERVIEASVVGMPSEEWGETPIAFVVLHPGAEAESVRADCNARVGKTQRLSGIRQLAELPRSPIGKVLKRELREGFVNRAVGS